MNDKYRYGALSTSAISSMHPKVPARISNVKKFVAIFIKYESSLEEKLLIKDIEIISEILNRIHV